MEFPPQGIFLKFSEILFLIDFHLITVANPYLNVSYVSCLRVAYIFLKTWGTCFSDDMLCGTVQFGVQYTGHPFLEYVAKNLSAG